MKYKQTYLQSFNVIIRNAHHAMNGGRKAFHVYLTPWKVILIRQNVQFSVQQNIIKNKITGVLKHYIRQKVQWTLLRSLDDMLLMNVIRKAQLWF